MQKSLQQFNYIIDSKGVLILGSNEPLQIGTPFEFVTKNI